MKRPLVSSGAGHSTGSRRTSARRSVTGTSRPAGAPVSVSAPPGLIPDPLHCSTTPASDFGHAYFPYKPSWCGRVHPPSAIPTFSLPIHLYDRRLLTASEPGPCKNLGITLRPPSAPSYAATVPVGSPAPLTVPARRATGLP